VGFDRSRAQRGGPVLLDALERRFWLDLWRAPVLDAVEEQGIETRRYGPVQLTVVAGMPHEPLLNLVLGAAEPGAVEGGHLEEALEWAESQGLDFRVPVTLGRSESAAAEDLLNQRGYVRADGLLRFARPASSSGLQEPPDIEVIEVEEFTEGFSDYPGEGFDLALTAWSFFDCLPERDGWRCYLALDRHEHPVAGASMTCHLGVAQLAFAATGEPARGQGCHTALLHRRIRDAIDAGCHTVFAEVEEPLDRLDRPSPAVRNLVRAGFVRLEVRPVWTPPPAPGEEAEDWDWEEDEEE
jgi:GNAT superfamily N-acetyltransferase